jgi:hypothetical protein
MTSDDERVPSWATWQRRPSSDADLLLLRGHRPALVDSGFVGHAEETAAWVRARTGDLALVVNTHPLALRPRRTVPPGGNDAGAGGAGRRIGTRIAA